MTIHGLGIPSVNPAPHGVGETSLGPRSDVSFTKVVEQFLTDVNSQQTQADQLVQQMATGRVENLHDVMLAVAKADLSFRTVLEVRNRLAEAYQEIMRMQV